MSVAQAVEVGSAKTIDEKIHLITRNLQEVMGGDVAVGELRKILAQRDLKIYWGTAPTGKPHIAYFVPMSKIADFLRAGCEVTILFADLHAYLDNQKAPWDLLKKRSEYYEQVIKAMLTAIHVPIEKLRFIKGTEYQLSADFSLDMYRLTALTTERNAKKAGAEVVKQVESPVLSGVIYPLLQALDEKYLGCDAQFGGNDQRKIFIYAEQYMPKIGAKKCVHLMNPMVPSLTGGKGNKMSSSDANSKIDLLDSEKDVQNKIKKAFAEPGNVEGNGLLAFTRHVLFPLVGDAGFTIVREEKHGGNLHFPTYEDLEKAYADQSLFPLDLKIQVAKSINELLQPIREKMSTPEMQQLIAEAYPAVVASSDVVVEEDLDAEPKDAAAAGANPEEAEVQTTLGAPDMTQDFYKMDLRVGQLKNVIDHVNADSLYTLDCWTKPDGSAHVPVVTNVKKTMTKEQLEGSYKVLLFNLKPASFKGARTEAMFLGGSGGADATTHGLVIPGGKPLVGSRLFLQGQGPVAAEVIARANDKVLTKTFSELATNEKGELTSNGVVVCAQGEDGKIHPVVMVDINGAPVPTAKFHFK